jgi:capsular polysaccharide biosynthesis protein
VSPDKKPPSRPPKYWLGARLLPAGRAAPAGPGASQVAGASSTPAASARVVRSPATITEVPQEDAAAQPGIPAEEGPTRAAVDDPAQPARQPGQAPRAHSISGRVLVIGALLGALLGILAGWYVEGSLGKEYTSRSTVQVPPTGAETIVDPLTNAAVSTPTEAVVVTSDHILSAAAEELDTALTRLRGQVQAVPIPNSTILEITATATTPENARDIVDSVVQHYIDDREERAEQAIAGFITAAEARIEDELIPSISDLNGQIADLPAGSSQRAVLNARVAPLQEELRTLSSQVATAQSRAVTPPSVLRPAQLPSAQDFPPTWTAIPAAGALGAAAALALLFWIRRRRDADR